MKISKASLPAFLVVYAATVILFFFLSIVQELWITERLNWKIILTDFSIDALFLTISFAFFRYLLRKVQSRNQIILAHKERYQQVLDNMKEGIQILDHDLRYLYLNDAAIQQSRYQRDELIGCIITEKYPAVQNTDLFRQMRACLLDKEVADIENEFVYPDGSTGCFELLIEPISEGLFILSLDISERKKREEERRRRMQETQQILFKISHEVRQPVVQLQGLEQMLNNNLVQIDELASISAMMKDSVALIDRRTRELSEYIHSIVIE